MSSGNSYSYKVLSYLDVSIISHQIKTKLIHEAKITKKGPVSASIFVWRNNLTLIVSDIISRTSKLKLITNKSKSSKVDDFS